MSRIRTRHVSVHRHGLTLEDTGEELPLYAGSMHYWRHDPSVWGPALAAVKAMGCRLLDTYVPWSVHEVRAGVFDFGRVTPRLDVARFLEQAGEAGLKVILRPGPHINAELTFFGIPERVVWDRACQARTPKDHAVVLPMVPRAFPVPSYASDAFHDEVAVWFDAVGRELSHLLHPHGPIVLLQVDNEGALYFRDGPYDQDYHPDAIRAFRSFLRDKYGSVRRLREAWGDGQLTFATATAKVRFDARDAAELPPHLDWMEFHEHLLAGAMERFGHSLEAAGLGAVPSFHNFPMGEAATALNAKRIGQVTDFLALDYYHSASPHAHRTILRRTSELVSRSEGMDTVAFGAEVGAGFPPIFAPLDEKDSLFTLLAALAYGLRGFNLYMAVDRDRWIGAPIDARGVPRPFADSYRALHRALEEVSFHRLVRRAPVRLVVPRVLRRLARAAHAFGPVTPSAFHIIGRGARESCFEEPLGFEELPPIAAERWILELEEALLAQGVPFAYAAGECLEASIAGASWVLTTTAGGIKPELLSVLRAASAGGTRVTIGPELPTSDGAMQPLSGGHDASGLEVEPLANPGRAATLVADAIRTLGLVTYDVEPDAVHVTVHEDEDGAPRVVFFLNSTTEGHTAEVTIAGVEALRDLLPARADATLVRAKGDSLVVEVPPRTVRMFAVVPAP